MVQIIVERLTKCWLEWNILCVMKWRQEEDKREGEGGEEEGIYVSFFVPQLYQDRGQYQIEGT